MDWVATVGTVLTITALAVGVVSVPHNPLYGLAKLLFVAAAVLFLTKAVWWGVTTTQGPWPRFILVGFIGALSAIGLMAAFRWVAEGELARKAELAEIAAAKIKLHPFLVAPTPAIRSPVDTAVPHFKAEKPARAPSPSQPTPVFDDPRKPIRVALADFLQEGMELMNKCGDETKPAPEQDADAWAGRVEAYLHDHLDDSYIARFRNGAGMPLGANSIASIPHRNLWGALRVRNYRLDQFITELSIPQTH